MKKLPAILCFLFSTVLFAHEIVTVHPTTSNSGKRWYPIAANGNVKLKFYFDTHSQRTAYSGYAHAIVWVDSADGTIGDRDSLTVSGYPLQYNHDTDAWEISSEANKDSFIIKSTYDWGANDADSTFDFQLGITDSIGICDGVQLNFYVKTDGQCKVRPEIRKTIDKR